MNLSTPLTLPRKSHLPPSNQYLLHYLTYNRPSRGRQKWERENKYLESLILVNLGEGSLDLEHMP